MGSFEIIWDHLESFKAWGDKISYTTLSVLLYLHSYLLKHTVPIIGRTEYKNAMLTVLFCGVSDTVCVVVKCYIYVDDNGRRRHRGNKWIWIDNCYVSSVDFLTFLFFKFFFVFYEYPIFWVGFAGWRLWVIFPGLSGAPPSFLKGAEMIISSLGSLPLPCLITWSQIISELLFLLI